MEKHQTWGHCFCHFNNQTCFHLCRGLQGTTVISLCPFEGLRKTVARFMGRIRPFWNSKKLFWTQQWDCFAGLCSISPEKYEGLQSRKEKNAYLETSGQQGYLFASGILQSVSGMHWDIFHSCDSNRGWLKKGKTLSLRCSKIAFVVTTQMWKAAEGFSSFFLFSCCGMGASPGG